MRTIYVVLAIVFATAIAGIWWSLGQRRRRAARMAEAALRLGLSHEADGKSFLGEPAGALPVFAMAQLGSGQILNVMRGHVGGAPAVICDYHWWSGTGSDRSDYEQTVFCFNVGDAVAPDFSLSPKLTAIERKMLNVAAVVWKLEVPEKDSGSIYGVQKTGTWMAIWKRNMTVKPEDLPTALNEAYAACLEFRDQQ